MKNRTLSICLMAAVPVVFSCSAGPSAIYSNSEYEWYRDSIVQHSYTATAPSVREIVSGYPSADGKTRRWTQKNDISGFGEFQGISNLETAIYNMAADELINNIEKDSTLRTGALWSGVWTRDISYSIVLSLADLVPAESAKSLMCKVDRLGRIVQDTGTGGSWPCSSDRIVWVMAAWKLYQVSGDVSWLQKIYPVIRRSLEDDFRVVYDKTTGLFRGESSFVDWREQSYPEWMQPVDIYNSECVGTNAVYYIAFRIMEKMAAATGNPQDSLFYSDMAARLSEAVNRNLWMEDKGWYAQYLYGRDCLVPSGRSETLGESLAVLSGIASEKQASRLVSSMPVSAYGPTIFWPQIGGMPNYHNNAVWPFVASYYAYAAAKAGNQDAVLHAIAGNVRAAALFATNQENFVASDGTLDTELNSPNMLWSLSGLLGIYRHLLIGIRMTEDEISFSPFVPERLDGTRTLKGIKYRDMVLDVTVSGHGSGIRSFRLDGKETASAALPDTLSGRHTVSIGLDGRFKGNRGINLRPHTVSPAVPAVSMEGNVLRWNKVPGAVSYNVFENGKQIRTLSDTAYVLSGQGEYSVAAVSGTGIESFISEPVRFGAKTYMSAVDRWLERGEGIAETVVDIEEDGYYSVEWEYSNGSGCIANKNMCATRSLYVDGEYAGVSVFPQRADGNWSEKGISNGIRLHLGKGRHRFGLGFDSWNENMNIDVNKVHISSCICRLAGPED